MLAQLLQMFSCDLRLVCLWRRGSRRALVDASETLSLQSCAEYVSSEEDDRREPISTADAQASFQGTETFIHETAVQSHRWPARDR